MPVTKMSGRFGGGGGQYVAISPQQRPRQQRIRRHKSALLLTSCVSAAARPRQQQQPALPRTTTTSKVPAAADALPLSSESTPSSNANSNATPPRITRVGAGRVASAVLIDKKPPLSPATVSSSSSSSSGSSSYLRNMTHGSTIANGAVFSGTIANHRSNVSGSDCDANGVEGSSAVSVDVTRSTLDSWSTSDVSSSMMDVSHAPASPLRRAPVEEGGGIRRKSSMDGSWCGNHSDDGSASAFSYDPYQSNGEVITRTLTSKTLQVDGSDSGGGGGGRGVEEEDDKDSDRPSTPHLLGGETDARPSPRQSHRKGGGTGRSSPSSSGVVGAGRDTATPPPPPPPSRPSTCDGTLDEQRRHRPSSSRKSSRPTVHKERRWSSPTSVLQTDDHGFSEGKGTGGEGKDGESLHSTTEPFDPFGILDDVLNDQKDVDENDKNQEDKATSTVERPSSPSSSIRLDSSSSPSLPHQPTTSIGSASVSASVSAILTTATPQSAASCSVASTTVASSSAAETRSNSSRRRSRRRKRQNDKRSSAEALRTHHLARVRAIAASHGPDSVRTSNALLDLGDAHLRCGEHGEALAAFKGAVRIRRGEEASTTNNKTTSLAVARALDRVGRAAGLCGDDEFNLRGGEVEGDGDGVVNDRDEEGLDDEEAGNADAVHVGHSGGCRRRNGNLDWALLALREAFATRHGQLGPHHPDTVETLNNLAGVHFRRNELIDARDAYKEVLTVRAALWGRTHPSVAVACRSLGRVHLRLGDAQGALRYFDWGVRVYVNGMGLEESHPSVSGLLRDVAGTERILLAQGGEIEMGTR